MKKKALKYIICTVIILCGSSIYSLNANFLSFYLQTPEVTVVDPDTIPARFPVSKTIPENYEDFIKESPADLKDPENVKTTVEYDIRTGMYVIYTRIGDMTLGTPISLTPEEYQDYSMQQSLRSYFRQKNEEEFMKETNKQFNITDMQFDIGAAEKIFGPGGVRVRTQGTAEVSLGVKRNSTKNPSLPESARTRTYFNFDEKVQLNVQANVGSKVNFDMNYNTETTFDFDSKKLKLAYTGEEDEIIKSIEAGNVSMSTSNSLINGGAALFGIKTDLQFGRLRVNALIAQQESESRTVNSRGGVQTKDFEITADQYDENRHFFLSHYFRDHYDDFMKNIPLINNGISIERIEVWITNNSSNYDQVRNIVAFSDLGEAAKNINGITPQPPANNSNDLYSRITQYDGSGGREISQATQIFGGFLEGGREFEKIESARLLDASEYTYNKELGYISLRSQLQPGQSLGVAFQYRYRNEINQVGEFSTDNSTNTTGNVFVKLLRGTNPTPSMPYWHLMMKNVYSLGAYSVQKDKFKLDILYQSDTTGTYLNYIPEGKIKNEILLRVMNLDRLDVTENPYPDGFFDFLEGLTIIPETGRVIFPVVEPFGSHLRKQIENDIIAEKYIYQELYDTTLTAARQVAEKNKFILRGEYKASSASEIQLGASNVARGSVRVLAGGVELIENVDYTVDYISGVVTILNENIINSGTSVSVTLENQSVYSMQRKTMLGLDLNYRFSEDFTIGGTIMHLSEMPLTTKTTIGDESLKNTLWGLNMAYRGENQWLTNALDKLPLLNLSKPSQITFNAEFAHLIAGHYENKYTGGYSYLDDFESAQSGIDLSNPYAWQLASTPFHEQNGGLFPEASLVNDVKYGNNRALLAWYYVDGIFTRKNSSLMPQHIKNDKDIQSNHYSRAVTYDEIYPNKDLGLNEGSNLQVMNMAFYPNERGPYNLDGKGMNPDGTLTNPEKRWGGMMRRIEQSNFETANVEYIEFWLLDPFIDNKTGTNTGGDLYFNLGDISEDILKDEKKFFENGLPIDGDMSKVDTTVWGRVPRDQSTVYAFDNTAGTRKLQDVGLNGLSTEDEKTFPAYVQYLEELRGTVSAETWANWENDPFSPINDPAGDNFHHYRGTDYDQQQLDILDRYKRYNGTEGNSAELNDSPESYSTAAKTVPDVEDLNQDNTLNEYENYYEYKVSLRPGELEVGKQFIVDKREVTKTQPNGDARTVTWYQFKIPVKQPQNTIGNINGFSSIRFMRMYMTDFRETTYLRFATLQLVRGEWRAYERTLNDKITSSLNTTFEVATVNIEENSDKDPVNYVLPPGVSRALDPGQPQLVQQNEQALSMKVTELASDDAKAVYKSMYVDLRQYKRMQLFTHAEALLENPDLSNGDLSVFIRLGSDYKNNYYEYEVPLTLTPHGSYSSNSTTDQYAVWPESNFMDFRFQVLTDLKLQRNKLMREGTHMNYQTPYYEMDPDNAMNKISVMGNPSLSEVKIIMIGVRNNSSTPKSAEVWVNELRLTDFNEDGGWAANANLNIALSDLGTVNIGGRIETAGFGGLDQSLNERRLDDYTQYNISTSLELGKLFPEKAKVSIPFYYAYSKEMTSPKYNPLDQDVLLKETLNTVDTKAEKDSIKSLSQDKSVVKSIAVNNVKVDIKSKNPMPYDPANFSVSYSYSELKNNNPETEYETTKDYRGSFSYNYTPYVKPFRPFSKIKKNNGYTRYIKQLGINYVPSNISFLTYMTRNYYEIQLRDLNYSSYEQNVLKPSFRQEFYWDRAFGLRWDFTNNLRTSFESGTNARIEEPHVQVNKKLNPDSYQVWKDSVKRSIAELGKPLAYDQTFNATYNLPLQFVPALDWINGSVNYRASYTWDRGSQITLADSLELGNTIQNQREWNIQAGFNVIALYNKNKFLRSVNQKFSSTRQTNTRQTERKVPRKLEKEVTLNTDSGTIVEHGMFTRKVNITARGADGRIYSIKYKPVSLATVRILNKDTVTLNLTIAPGRRKNEEFWHQTAEHTSRFLMMLRRVNVTYAMTDGMTLPGFREEIGDIFGQKRTSYGMAPGVGFAFGGVSRNYIDRAIERDWLIRDENLINPAIMNMAKNLNINTNLEPVTGLRIDLTAMRVDSRNTEIQYMYDGMPEQYGGNFVMSTVGVKSFFSGMGNALNGYSSKAFDDFRSNRFTIAERLDNSYQGLNYPNSISGGYAGSPAIVEHSENSTEALIPAFLSAYTGKSVDKISLTPFPSLSSMLPNWRITYDGLLKVPLVQKYFKSIQLSHQYRGSYTVGGYSSYIDWVNVGIGDRGFRPSTNEGEAPIPSSPYIISSVTISDGFSPLVGVDGTLLNNVTLSTQYRTSRILNLNISSFQLIESHTREYVLGLGYKWAEFNKVLKMKQARDFSNDLTLRLDFSYRKTLSLLRKIDEDSNQLTSGNAGKMIQFTADYGVSRALTFRAFYDMQINTPLVSSSSYPTTDISCGVSVVFSLAQ